MNLKSLAAALVLAGAILAIPGCTDPTQPPLLLQILPNPVVPVSSPQNVDFLGSNLDADVYFMIDTGQGWVLLEPQYVPGHWTFRCAFGFHFIYTFDSLRNFVHSQGDPSQMSVRAFNVGPNMVPEHGGGDDLHSAPFIWTILD